MFLRRHQKAVYMRERAAQNPRIQRPQYDLVFNPIGVSRVHNVNLPCFSCGVEQVSRHWIINSKSYLTFNLLNRPLEPLPSRNKPKRDRVQHNYTDSNDRVVECLRINRVGLRQDEDDRDEAYPQHGNCRNWIREFSEMKGPSLKVLTVPESEGNWDSVRDVQSYSCDTI